MKLRAIDLAIANIEARGPTPDDAAVLASYLRMKTRATARDRVRRELTAAVKRGDVVRTACEHCGAPKVEAHHVSYSPALWVWLCAPCHLGAHKATRQVDRSPDQFRFETEFARLSAMAEPFPSAAAIYGRQSLFAST